MVIAMTEKEFEKYGKSWANHQLTFIVNDDPKLGNKWSLAVNGQRMHSVHFRNIDGLCLISGDYGNWIASRYFDPRTDDSICLQYFCEKLRLGGEHKTHEFCVESTKQEIIETLYRILEENGQIPTVCDGADDLVPIELFDYSNVADEVIAELPDRDEELYRYYLECLKVAEDGEEEYIQYAFGNLPRKCSSDDIIVQRSVVYYVRVVHSAFCEMVKRVQTEVEANNG